MADDTSSSKLDQEMHGNKGPTAETIITEGEVPISVLEDGSLDPVYEAKAKVLNKAIQDIGMGRYQWQLFVVIGFGWAMDNLWPTVTSLILAPITNEFHPTQPPFLSLAQNIGLLVGAVFWGFGCDIFGRRWAFNLTIGITAVFGLAAAGSPGFGAIGTFAALWSVMGGVALLMFIARFLLFTIFESPKFLMGKGNDSEAVRIVHEVARRNGKTTPLTLSDLRTCNLVARPGTSHHRPTTAATAAIKRNLSKFDLSHIKALFATPKLALSTTLITTIWALIGLGYPLYNAFLPYIQATRGVVFADGSTYITYRNSLIIAVLGIPGCLLGGLLVETRHLGRKGTLALSTTLTGVFLLASTTATSSNALLGWNCAFNFMSNIMYAVLYAYTPEIFPTKDRGTGNAVTASANRVFGIMAPIVAMFADLKTSAPVYASGGLFVVAGGLVLVLPFESRGRASM
ncbi:hypothetical protein PTT_14579 [Pyrenophora teres f. teres 0-1]|uniref:Membrane transporter n=1 Tax=Pyrenophora teres f. teres (strain 0-1) TaxID=861557 RepID=E3RYG5_PYRTT|nr:hypothetical protein PTT_14579 [Pyrenophora teres f. teres 0-1]